MSCKYICDGCGKEQMGEQGQYEWIKPSEWFARTDKDRKIGTQHACCRECIEKIAQDKGVTSVVLPV